MENQNQCCREVTPQEQIQKLTEKVYQLEGIIDILKDDFMKRTMPKPVFKEGDKVIYKPSPNGKTQIETEIVDISPSPDFKSWAYSIFIFERVAKAYEEQLILNQ